MDNESDEMIAVLALEDGGSSRPSLRRGGCAAGQQGRRGEVVFNTAMTGYQEICTDPSYRGQMVVLTYPLVGNYGVALDDAESRRPWLSALLVRECSDEYSNWRARGVARRLPGAQRHPRHLRVGHARAHPPPARPRHAARRASARSRQRDARRRWPRWSPRRGRCAASANSTWWLRWRRGGARLGRRMAPERVPATGASRCRNDAARAGRRHGLQAHHRPLPRRARA